MTPPYVGCLSIHRHEDARPIHEITQPDDRLWPISEVTIAGKEVRLLGRSGHGGGGLLSFLCEPMQIGADNFRYRTQNAGTLIDFKVHAARRRCRPAHAMFVHSPAGSRPSATRCTRSNRGPTARRAFGITYPKNKNIIASVYSRTGNDLIALLPGRDPPKFAE